MSESVENVLVALQDTMYNERDPRWQKAVRFTITGNLAGLKDLICAGLNIHSKFPRKLVKSVEISRMVDDPLWDAGYDSMTLMHAAAGHGQCEILRLLLRHGAAVDAVGHGSEAVEFTPLSEATKAGHLQAVELLLQCGARIEHCHRSSAFAADLLTGALDARPGDEFSDDRRSIYDLLLSHGASISFDQSKNYARTMEMAVRYNQLDLIKQLLDLGVRCDRGLRAFVANDAADEDLLSLVLSNGAADVKEALDPGIIDGVEMNRRHITPAGGFNEWSAEMTHRRRKNLSLVLSRFPDFLDTTEAIDATVLAAKTNDIMLLEVLKEHGMHLNGIGSQGACPLHFAILSYRPRNSLEWLLTNGVDLERRAEPRGVWGAHNAGRTPLLLAASRNDVYAVGRLLDAQADIHARCNEGETPFLTCCRLSFGPTYFADTARRQAHVLERLYGAGSDVYATRSDGKNALHILAHFNTSPEAATAFVTNLIAYGTDLYARDHDGMLPVHYAIQNSGEGSTELQTIMKACTHDYVRVLDSMTAGTW